MSDIAFLLLIFIIVISLLNTRQEIKIEYPEAEFQEVTQADENFEIWITHDGVIFYNGMSVQLEELENEIVDAVVDDPGVRIHLIADRKTPYKYINGIIELLKLLQHRAVSFVVEDRGKSGGTS